MNIFLIFIGGGLGSVLRYLCNVVVRNFTGNDFPYGIMAINILGSLAIGLSYGLIKKAGMNADHIADFIIIGVLGGFTTFSAFSLDVVTLVNNGRIFPALIYVLASVVLSIIAAFIGLSLAK